MLQAHGDARVLLVDDDDDNAVLLQRMLARYGMKNVHTITDPRAVVGRLSAVDPDLVLLDLQMPHLDGHTVLRHVRTWAGETYLPIVVLTSDTSPETLRTALAEGATDFLTKPFNATEIAIRIRNLLETRALYLALQACRRPQDVAERH
jgi:CheY-like chemotaxis protein